MRSRPSWLARLTLQKIHVTTLEEQTFEGLLATEAPDGLVLTGATLHTPDGPVPMAGTVYLPRERIAFVQVVGSSPSTG